MRWTCWCHPNFAQALLLTLLRRCMAEWRYVPSSNRAENNCSQVIAELIQSCFA
jgi:hypothetical protein